MGEQGEGQGPGKRGFRKKKNTDKFFSIQLGKGKKKKTTNGEK